MSELQFAAIGLDHDHINGMTAGMLASGAHCTGYWTQGSAHPLKQFSEQFADIPRIKERARLLENDAIDLVLIAAPAHERAALAIEAMRHGKDVMVDKPGCVTLEELDAIRATVAQTGRIWSVYFSERFEVRAASVASRLVREGQIGQLVQMMGMGPHRLNPTTRADWFWDRSRSGGILCDIASHQIDQFLHFAGIETAEIAHSAVGNMAHPDHPAFEDFGEVALAAPNAQAYIRVDWFTPDALPVWGDGRLFLVGTEGTIELRKYLDLSGRAGKDHLFLANQTQLEYIDCSGEALTYFSDLKRDIAQRSETACGQAHAFTATELAIKAQMQAQQRGYLKL